ncbi:hypothetical protein GWO43_01560, partial [candidate division KSB1 bacterium]|nr:hypothetical protein [candidate division KSB1 bacterium]NIT69604.1 hypothetical protein [candidate division KSB1 bacterium]NIX69285.1 hypothetical protein [candidate division KSB1 bacterium]
MSSTRFKFLATVFLPVVVISLLLITNSTLAFTTGTVTGVVTDKQTGEPLPG